MGGRLRQFHLWFFQGSDFSGSSVRRKDPPSSAPPTSPHPHGSRSWGRRQSSRPPGLALWLWLFEGRRVDRPRCGDFAGGGRLGQQETLQPRTSLLPARLCAGTGKVCHLICTPTRRVSVLGPVPHHQLRVGPSSVLGQHPMLSSHLRSESLLQVSGTTGWSTLPWCPALCAGPVPV